MHSWPFLHLLVNSVSFTQAPPCMASGFTGVGERMHRTCHFVCRKVMRPIQRSTGGRVPKVRREIRRVILSV
jgi:hypothetical protein